MGQTVELSTLNRRYEQYRIRDDAGEARLLASIAARGIEEPVEGVDTPEGRLLLNGFKRCRCAVKLGIGCLPYRSLGDEEAAGILHLMRVPAGKSLNILEQARFIEDLLSIHGMQVADVAETLSRSKAWVSMRRSLLREMSGEVQRILFRGSFPVYCYMYIVRQFMRMNSVGRDEVERFMKSVACKRLSVRDIELLAHAYFRGPDSLREAIDNGNFSWSLEQMKNVPEDREGCTPPERQLLKDLQILRKYIGRVMPKCHDQRLNSRAFFAQSHLLTGNLLCVIEPFSQKVKELHDRSGLA